MAAKHPRGLYALFFTEMWERFGYYTVLAIFSLYLNERLGMSEGDSASLYGTFIGAVYLSPLFGGLLADRVVGYSRSVLIGAALMAGGYGLLALDHPSLLYLSLGIIVLGNGLFKPNISTLVGNLYPQGDVRRDSAFSIFYMGINIGAFFSPLVAGWARARWGWGAAFGAAGIGMVVGFVTFAILRQWVATAERRSSIGAVLDMPLPAEYEDRPAPPTVERERIRALGIMTAIVMLFWVAFHQNGSTLVFWARDNTDLTLGGWLKNPIPPEWTEAINSFFVVALTPVLIRVFAWLRHRGLEPTNPGKIALGMVLTAVAFGIMAAAALAGGNNGRVSMWWLVGSYFVVTVAELCLSPMGLSMVTKLAPRRMTSLMMGVWFLATAIGNKLSGEIGIFWKKWPHHVFFGVLVLSSLFAAGLLVVQLRRLAAAMPREG